MNQLNNHLMFLFDYRVASKFLDVSMTFLFAFWSFQKLRISKVSLSLYLACVLVTLLLFCKDPMTKATYKKST